MSITKTTSRTLPLFFLLNMVALLISAGLMVILARNGSFSLIRALLIGGTCILALAYGVLLVLFQINSEKNNALYLKVFNLRTANRLIIGLAILFIIYWGLTWLVVHQTERFYYYFIGVYPLILYGTFTSGLGLILLISERDDSFWTVWNRYWHEHRVVLIISLIGLAGICSIGYLTAQLGILNNPEPYWYGAGVPLLAWQVFVTLLIAILAIALEIRLFRTNKTRSLVLFLLIWIIAAIFWARQPLSQSFWITPRLPPNFENYPFSDLVIFDIGSQFALIGQGINNHMFFDRALYMSFLVYLHAIGGQDFQHLMAIQAAIFAVFPALLYLIGEKLHSRIAGIILAVLIIMRGSNSLIATTWIYTSTFKHMLTDFPTAIGLAVFTLLVIKLLEDPQHRWQDAGWAAGTLGLTSLLRPHVLLILPALLLLVFWVFRSRLKLGLALAGFTLIACMASVSPWAIFGPANGSIFTLYWVRIEDVIRQRYLPSTFTPSLMSVLPAAGPILDIQTPSGQPDLLQSKKTIPFQITHFLHNLVTSAMIFPDSPQFLTIKETVRGGENFWSSRWNGSMSTTASGMLILNLAIVSFGLGAAFKQCSWRGFLPLAVFFIYYAADALARTSGGRYLVPIDWVLLVYFSLGLAEIIQIGRLSFDSKVSNTSNNNSYISESTDGAKKNWLPRTLGVLLIVTIAGGTVPLAGYLYPPRYSGNKPSNLVDKIAPYFPTLGLKRADVENFLLQPQAVIFEGRELYPRFYPQGQGEPNPMPPYTNFGFPRLELLLISPHGLDYVFLPGGQPKVFPNASDAIMLGCSYTISFYNVASALVVVLPEQRVAYVRSPQAPLTCPLPDPVCTNNKECH